MIKKLIKQALEKYILKDKDTMSLKESLDLTELPIVTFTQGDLKLNFLLDTGSNNCIIDSSIIDTIEHEDLNQQSTLFGLEGKVTTVRLCKIKTYYKDIAFEYDYLIQDMSTPFESIKKETGVKINGILGSNFFQKFKYVLDFAELIAYSKK